MTTPNQTSVFLACVVLASTLLSLAWPLAGLLVCLTTCLAFVVRNLSSVPRTVFDQPKQIERNKAILRAFPEGSCFLLEDGAANKSF